MAMRERKYMAQTILGGEKAWENFRIDELKAVVKTGENNHPSSSSPLSIFPM